MALTLFSKTPESSPLTVSLLFLSGKALGNGIACPLDFKKDLILLEPIQILLESLRDVHSSFISFFLFLNLYI